MTGANTSLPATVLGTHTVPDENGKPTTAVQVRYPDGSKGEWNLSGVDPHAAQHFRPGDSIRTMNGQDAYLNDSQNAVIHDSNGHMSSEKIERSGKIAELHHKNHLPDDHPGARANSVILSDGHHVHVSPNKDGRDVIDGQKVGDDVTIGRDEHGRAVVYNATQHSVSRADAHGHYHTVPQDERRVAGELVRIERDPKHPGSATLVLEDGFGDPQRVDVAEPKPGQLDALLKKGDLIDGVLKETSPGRSDVSITDRTRHTTIDTDHNGKSNIVAGRTVERVPGVNHQFGNGPEIPTTPGAGFDGKVSRVTQDHGTIKVEYANMFEKPHSIVIDSRTQPALAHAVQGMKPGDDFHVDVKQNGFELTNYTQHQVTTPSRNGQGVETTPWKETPAQTQAVGNTR